MIHWEGTTVFSHLCYLLGTPPPTLLEPLDYGGLDKAGESIIRNLWWILAVNKASPGLSSFGILNIPKSHPGNTNYLYLTFYV